MTFPTEKDIKQEPEAVRVMPDGKERCNMATMAGKREYLNRINLMVERQNGRCCLEGYIPQCPGRLTSKGATFEHENGRGAGKQDDRLELPDGTWINGAAHWICNSIKGSKRIPYNVPNNTWLKAERDAR
jgi:hypothetical protein